MGRCQAAGVRGIKWVSALRGERPVVWGSATAASEQKTGKAPCFKVAHPRYQHVCRLLIPVRLSVAPWTAACQAPVSMGFSRQEHWSGLPFPTLEDLCSPGIEP